MNFVRSREAVGKAGWNPTLVNKPQMLDDPKYNNYFKQLALISSSPSEIPRDWFLTNEMMIQARNKKEAGARRMMAHGPARSNLRYGYVTGPVDWSAFA